MLKKGYQSIQHLRIVPLFFILTKPRVYDGILKKTSKGVYQDESILIFWPCKRLEIVIFVR